MALFVSLNTGLYLPLENDTNFMMEEQNQAEKDELWMNEDKV